MSSIERSLGFVASVIAIVPVFVAVVGFFLSRELDITLLLLICTFLVILLFLNWSMYRGLISSKKPPLVKAYNDPDTYLFLHGQWRKIPDWETRDYLASVLGFRPGEEDITLKPKSEVDALRKGAPLESIYTQARRK